jgi:predicted permease
VRLGRDFRPGEDQSGRHGVLILSHRAWQNRFGGDLRIIGRTVRLDGAPHEIVGVLPASFNDWRHLGFVDFFRPLGLSATEAADRTTPSLRLLGRRSSTLPPAQTAALVAQTGRRLAADFPAIHAGTTWRAVPLNDLVAGKNGAATLGLLLGLSGFVLLIACSNLANLLLARTMARAREFAVRAALGATRAQILRPLACEALLLAFAGGVCAIIVALWVHDWLAVVSTGDNGERVVLRLDWAVHAWAFFACLVTALAFGLAPALFALRLNPIETLKRGGRSTTGDRGHRRFRSALIVGQFALAMILLAGAALFVSGLRTLNTRRAGWQSDRLVTGSIALPAATYPSATELNAFHRLALTRLSALPGVESVSLSSALPFFGFAESRTYLIAGQPPAAPGQAPAATLNGVSPDYFATVGTPLVRGRTFTTADTATTPRVFVISQAAARGLFGDANPLGQRLARTDTPTPEWGEIVGVVGDTASIFPDPGPVTFQLYQPLAQEPRAATELAVRTAGPAPSTLVDSIRTTLAALNADLPVRQLQPADLAIDRDNHQLTVLGHLLSGLACLGLGLAALGISGVVARTVAQRTGEFGIRLALGAQREDLTRLVLTSGLKLALLGSALGLLGALGVSKILSAEFPGLHAHTFPVFLGVTLLLLAVALLASWLPARRAARLDPLTALRAE